MMHATQEEVVSIRAIVEAAQALCDAVRAARQVDGYEAMLMKLSAHADLAHRTALSLLADVTEDASTRVHCDRCSVALVAEKGSHCDRCEELLAEERVMRAAADEAERFNAEAEDAYKTARKPGGRYAGNVSPSNTLVPWSVTS